MDGEGCVQAHSSDIDTLAARVDSYRKLRGLGGLLENAFSLCSVVEGVQISFSLQEDYEKAVASRTDLYGDFPRLTVGPNLITLSRDHRRPNLT